MAITGTTTNNNSNLSLEDAITYMTEQRDDKLFCLTDRIKLHFGTEEELIKQLREVIRINNYLETLKIGLDALQFVSEYQTMKNKEKLK
jgi:hypothetical protein